MEKQVNTIIMKKQININAIDALNRTLNTFDTIKSEPDLTYEAKKEIIAKILELTKQL
jgi:hypothetical protein